MNRNSMNQDNDRVGSNGYGQMNRGFENDQRSRGQDDDNDRDSDRFDDRYGTSRSLGGYDDNRPGSNRSFGGYDDNRMSTGQGDRSMSGYRGNDRSMSGYRDNDRNDEAGYGGSRYSGYRGTDDRSHHSQGYDDRGFSRRGFSGNEEYHPHDEHERGRWGQDYGDRGGHRYEGQGGMTEARARFHRDEGAFQRSGYQSHGVYDRNRMGMYQDRDNRGRFNDTGEGPSHPRQGYTGGFDQRYDRQLEHDDRGRFGGHDGRARGGFESESRYSSDDVRRYGQPDYGYGDRNYGRGGYGHDDRQRDEQRGRGGSMTSGRFGHNDNDSDRRWTGGGYEEDRRGRGRGRY